MGTSLDFHSTTLIKAGQMCARGDERRIIIADIDKCCCIRGSTAKKKLYLERQFFGRELNNNRGKVAEILKQCPGK